MENDLYRSVVLRTSWTLDDIENERDNIPENFYLARNIHPIANTWIHFSFSLTLFLSKEIRSAMDRSENEKDQEQYSETNFIY